MKKKTKCGGIVLLRGDRRREEEKTKVVGTADTTTRGVKVSFFWQKYPNSLFL